MWPNIRICLLSYSNIYLYATIHNALISVSLTSIGKYNDWWYFCSHKVVKQVQVGLIFSSITLLRLKPKHRLNSTFAFSSKSKSIYRYINGLKVVFCFRCATQFHYPDAELLTGIEHIRRKILINPLRLDGYILSRVCLRCNYLSSLHSLFFCIIWCRISCESDLTWELQNLTDDKFIWFQAMTWCRQPTDHCLNEPMMTQMYVAIWLY